MSPHIIDLEKRAFQLLPVEVNENIASFLDTDKDFANFNAICLGTRNTIQSHRCGAWRAQWKQEYDLPLGMTGLQIKAEYQRRRMVLHTRVFHMGTTTAEKNCIATLKQLIIESFTGSSKKTSNNVLRLQRFLEESNILHALNTCIVGHCTLEIQALLACLAHWYLHPLQNLPHVSYYVFPTSRLIVYSKLTEFPIFLGDGEMAAARVNVYTVLHMINFWRYHTNETDYGVLNDISHMRGWTRPTEEHGGPSGLSRHWNGISGRIHHCYKVGGLYLTMAGAAYLYDFSDMRSLREHSLTSDPFFIGREVQLDELDECRDVEAIEFDFEQAHNTAVWPKAFEDHLQALPPVPFHSYNKSSTRADDIGDPCTLRKPFLPKSQKMVSLQKCSGYLRFSGSVEPDDYGPNYQGISGILHDLPEQSGIPGFQRISFMQYAISAPKHEGDDDDHVMGSWRSKVLHDQVDETCYCYQGVVLPGGQIILGRWWSPFNDADQLCTGPFMLWAVEE